MSEERAIAQKSDWNTCEMPLLHKSFKLKRSFSEEELQNLRYGHVPQEMEDKWFWYMEGNTLFAHRSWTGACIYIVKIDEKKGVHKVTLNMKDYRSSVNSVERKKLNDLLNWWTQPQYDYYGEWITETVESLNSARRG